MGMGSVGGGVLILPGVVVNHEVRKLCTKPYYNHPKGCPNYGQRPTCPPQAPLVGDIIDLNEQVYAVYNIFPLAEHVRHMRLGHPDWSYQQLSCCLYWQQTARKQLRAALEIFHFRYDDERPIITLECPEACGVDVTSTMAQMGHQLEWPPKKVVYQIALVGCRNMAKGRRVRQ